MDASQSNLALVSCLRIFSMQTVEGSNHQPSNHHQERPALPPELQPPQYVKSTAKNLQHFELLSKNLLMIIA